MNLKTKTNPKATIPKSPHKKITKRSTHTGISSSVPALNRFKDSPEAWHESMSNQEPIYISPIKKPINKLVLKKTYTSL